MVQEYPLKNPSLISSASVDSQDLGLLLQEDVDFLNGPSVEIIQNNRDLGETVQDDIKSDLLEVRARYKGIRFMFIDLKAGVTPTNLIFYYLLWLDVIMVLFIKTSIMAYLLIADYGIPQHDSGLIIGRIGLFSEICVLPFPIYLRCDS